MIYLTNINLNQNELQNVVLHPLATAPANPKLGQLYYDTTDFRIKQYNGADKGWEIVGVIVESSQTNGNIVVDGVEMTVYTLPAATADTLGGIKVGTGLTVLADGTLSVDFQAANAAIKDAKDAAEAAQKDVDALEQKVDAMYTNAQIDTAVADAKKAGTDAQADVDALETVVADNKTAIEKTVADNKAAIEKTVADNKAAIEQTVADNKTAIENTVAALDAVVKANETDIEKKVSDLTAVVDTKVTKVDGKGLSTEDFTTDEKTKLAGIATGAEVNVQADWNVDDATSDAFILNKPTALSQFTNDENFIDNTVADLVNYYTKSEVFTKDEINTKIGEIAIIQIVVPADGQLPATGKTNELYLIPKDGVQPSNSYDEYLWTGSAFEKIGDTEIDLSDYLTKTGDASATTVAFTPAADRVAPATGETVAVIMGKVAKYLADLHAVAFTGSYNDLIDKPVLVKYQTANLGTVDGTQKIITVEGTKVLGVTLTDAVTHEVLAADVTINGTTVTVKISAVYANGIDILVEYI